MSSTAAAPSDEPQNVMEILYAAPRSGLDERETQQALLDQLKAYQEAVGPEEFTKQLCQSYVEDRERGDARKREGISTSYNSCLRPLSDGDRFTVAGNGAETPLRYVTRQDFPYDIWAFLQDAAGTYVQDNLDTLRGAVLSNSGKDAVRIAEELYKGGAITPELFNTILPSSHSRLSTNADIIIFFIQQLGTVPTKVPDKDGTVRSTLAAWCDDTKVVRYLLSNDSDYQLTEDDFNALKDQVSAYPDSSERTHLAIESDKLTEAQKAELKEKLIPCYQKEIQQTADSVSPALERMREEIYLTLINTQNTVTTASKNHHRCVADLNRLSPDAQCKPSYEMMQQVRDLDTAINLLLGEKGSRAAGR